MFSILLDLRRDLPEATLWPERGRFGEKMVATALVRDTIERRIPEAPMSNQPTSIRNLTDPEEPDGTTTPTETKG